MKHVKNVIPNPQAIETGPWDDGSKATFTPWSDGYLAGFKCVVNGVVSYVYFNPSTGGGSPDLFIYNGPHGNPEEDSSVCFITPPGSLCQCPLDPTSKLPPPLNDQRECVKCSGVRVSGMQKLAEAGSDDDLG